MTPSFPPTIPFDPLSPKVGDLIFQRLSHYQRIGLVVSPAQGPDASWDRAYTVFWMVTINIKTNEPWTAGRKGRLERRTPYKSDGVAPFTKISQWSFS